MSLEESSSACEPSIEKMEKHVFWRAVTDYHPRRISLESGTVRTKYVSHITLKA